MAKKSTERKRPPTKTSFKPGHKLSVGNRGHTLERRQAKRVISSAIMHMLESKIRNKDGSLSRYADRIAKNLLTIATSNSKQAVHAIKEIIDRTEGRAIQAIELSGPDKGPVEMITREMTPAEAARVYQRMLRED